MRAGAVLQHASRGFLQMMGNGFALRSSFFARNLATPPTSTSDPVKTEETVPENEFDHATGMEKAEIEGLNKGVDIFHEDWITKEFAGTPEDPVVVESAFDERIIGVPDPEDDCLVIWDLIKADEPPKQIIEGGEYFVLKTSKPPAWTGLPESFKGGDAHH